MGVKEETETGGKPVQSVAGVVAGSFSGIVLLAAISYAVMANVVNWVALDILAYPEQGVAPFVVISGAILTIPILIPTVLISVRVLKS